MTTPEKTTPGPDVKKGDIVQLEPSALGGTMPALYIVDNVRPTGVWAYSPGPYEVVFAWLPRGTFALVGIAVYTLETEQDDQAQEDGPPPGPPEAG